MRIHKGEIMLDRDLAQELRIGRKKQTGNVLRLVVTIIVACAVVALCLINWLN